MSANAVMPEFAFALASCQYPAGLLDGPLARRAFDALVLLPKTFGVNRLVVPGDQIYVDATAGMFDPVDVARGRSAAYETVISQRNALIGRGIEVHTMLDDHEIDDNWEPVSEPDSAENAKLKDASCEAYVAGCRTVDPGKLTEYRQGTRLWYDFAASGHRFFMADTRTERTLRHTRLLQSASIMSAPQMDALHGWIAAAPTDRLSFVVCPAIVLPRRLATSGRSSAAIHSDAWDGYPASLHALLAMLCDAGNERIVLLSGDEHFPCVARIELWRAGVDARRTVLYSIHGPALYAPYPFANGSGASLALDETFAFAHAGVDYQCAVATDCPTADNGFAVVAVHADGAGWRLELAFHSAETGAIDRRSLAIAA